MSNLFLSIVALDTNVLIHAIRAAAEYPACRALVFERLHLLQLHFPFEIRSELHRNLNAEEMEIAVHAMKAAHHVFWSYEVPPFERISYWQNQGAKKGDAVICAALEAADVKFLISENRHFLQEINELPFEVLSAQNLLDRIKT